MIMVISRKGAKTKFSLTSGLIIHMKLSIEIKISLYLIKQNLVVNKKIVGLCILNGLKIISLC